MSITVTWDATFIAAPQGTESRRLGDDRIREFKTAVTERAELEHVWSASEASSGHGWHREGSAKTYVDASEPTTRPDGATSLSSGDAGRLWVDSDDDVLYYYDGSAWTAIGVSSSTVAPGSARQLLQTNAGGTASEWASNIDIPGTLDVTGATTMDSTLGVTGAVTLSSTLGVTGASTFTSGSFSTTLGVTGAVTLGSTLGVTGVLTTSAGIVMSSAAPAITTNTSDGSDTKELDITGGGSNSITRGAQLRVHGNEHPTRPGYAEILTGNVSGALIRFIAGAGNVAMTIDENLRIGINGSPATGSGVKVVIHGSSGGGTGTATPVALRIQDNSTGAAWDTANSAVALDFYQADTSGNGAGVRGRIGLVATTASGGAWGLSFFVDDSAATATLERAASLASVSALSGMRFRVEATTLRRNAWLSANSLTDGDAGVVLYENNTEKWRIYNDGDASDVLKVSGDGGTTAHMQLSTTALTLGVDAIIPAYATTYRFGAIADTGFNYAIHLQSAASGQNAGLRIFTADGDGTDQVALQLFAVGTPASFTNREYLQIGWDPAEGFIIRSEAAGTGAQRRINLHSGLGNTNQLILETAGHITSNEDEDQYVVFGRAWVGYDGATTDVAMFGHYDQRGPTTYALGATNAGATRLNAASGQTISLRVNNSEVASISSTGFGATRFSSIELGDASDTTLARSAAGVITVEGGYIPSGDTAVKYKVVNIGDWNMDSTGAVNIAHGLTLSTIRSVRAVIQDDAGTQFYPVPPDASSSLPVYIGYMTGTNVVLGRLASGFFDSTDFNATSYNRGWIIIEYTA